MNAREKGESMSLTAMLMYTGVSKESFEKLAKHFAQHAYASEKKRAEFIEGFLSGYVEPHVKNCDCEECQMIRADIVTY